MVDTLASVVNRFCLGFNYVLVSGLKTALWPFLMRSEAPLELSKSSSLKRMTSIKASSIQFENGTFMSHLHKHNTEESHYTLS